MKQKQNSVLILYGYTAFILVLLFLSMMHLFIDASDVYEDFYKIIIPLFIFMYLIVPIPLILFSIFAYIRNYKISKNIYSFLISWLIVASIGIYLNLSLDIYSSWMYNNLQWFNLIVYLLIPAIPALIKFIDFISMIELPKIKYLMLIHVAFIPLAAIVANFWALNTFSRIDIPFREVLVKNNLIFDIINPDRYYQLTKFKNNKSLESAYRLFLGAADSEKKSRIAIEVLKNDNDVLVRCIYRKHQNYIIKIEDYLQPIAVDPFTDIIYDPIGSLDTLALQKSQQIDTIIYDEKIDSLIQSIDAIIKDDKLLIPAPLSMIVFHLNFVIRNLQGMPNITIESKISDRVSYSSFDIHSRNRVESTRIKNNLVNVLKAHAFK